MPASSDTRRVIFVENEDSFSWNVVDRLPCERREVTILPGRALGRDPRELPPARALVIGPGPMDPIRAGLIDLVRVAAERRIPTLGICLGHQALGLAFGARLVRTMPVHGKRSAITFEESRLFPGLGGTLQAMRYHSLALADVYPPLRVIAWSDDRVPMAIEHETLPMAGLQFHPDSFATDRGIEILAAFFRDVP